MGRHRKQFNELKPQNQRRREVQARALIQFAETMDKPLSTAPVGETVREKRVRHIQDILKRIHIARRSGMLKAMNIEIRGEWLRQDTEHALVIAKREVRFERGDY